MQPERGCVTVDILCEDFILSIFISHTSLCRLSWVYGGKIFPSEYMINLCLEM